MSTLTETSAFARNRRQLASLPHDKSRILLSVDKEENKLYCLILSKDKLEFKSFTESLTANDIHKLVLTYTRKGNGPAGNMNISTFDLDLEADPSKRKVLEVELQVEENSVLYSSTTTLNTTTTTNEPTPPPPPKSSVYYGDADA